MNRYGRVAMEHWRKWLPRRCGELTNAEEFFTAFGDEIGEQVALVSAALAGDDLPGESYLEKVGRLNMARLNAESQVLRELAFLEPEPDRTAGE